MLGEWVEDHTWVSLGVWGSCQCRGHEGEQTGFGVWRWEVGDSRRGRVCDKATHTRSRHGVKAKYGNLDNPRGFICLHKPALIIRTYPKEEKVRLLCSVLSPKPRSDCKNRMLTPTILTRLCYPNNLKPDSYLLSTAPLLDRPCFLCLLHLPSTM